MLRTQQECSWTAQASKRQCGAAPGRLWQRHQDRLHAAEARLEPENGAAVVHELPERRPTHASAQARKESTCACKYQARGAVVVARVARARRCELIAGCVRACAEECMRLAFREQASQVRAHWCVLMGVSKLPGASARPRLTLNST
eukprot:694829-Rhodomonas_salina.4